MAVRRITVLGGSGFIGRHLVQRLAGEGWIVRVAVRDPQAAAFLKPLGEPGQIIARRVDITDPQQLESVVTGSDAVVNLVGILYERGRRTFERLHVEAPRRLAKLCKTAGVKRFVHVSALGVSEAGAARYARSKAVGERVIRDTFQEAVLFRPSVVFGPEDDFFNRFATLARISPILPVFTDDIPNGAGPRFQPVYVGDVADALMQGITSSTCLGKTYELGGPKIYTLREILALVLRETGRRRLLVPVPFWMARLEARFLQYWPKPLLTPDQVTLLREDNVLSGTLPGFKALGLDPTAPEAIVPTYLGRYREGGSFVPRQV